MIHNHLRAIFEVYFAINCFLVGLELEQARLKNWKLFLYLFIVFVAGVIFLLLEFICKILNSVYRYLNNNFQLGFFFTFYLTKEFDNLSEHRLEIINKKSIILGGKNTIRGKIFTYCTSLINKRNNYKGS